MDSFFSQFYIKIILERKDFLALFCLCTLSFLNSPVGLLFRETYPFLQRLPSMVRGAFFFYQIPLLFTDSYQEFKLI